MQSMPHVHLNKSTIKKMQPFLFICEARAGKVFHGLSSSVKAKEYRLKNLHKIETNFKHSIPSCEWLNGLPWSFIVGNVFYYLDNRLRCELNSTSVALNAVALNAVAFTLSAIAPAGVAFIQLLQRSLLFLLYGARGRL